MVKMNILMIADDDDDDDVIILPEPVLTKREAYSIALSLQKMN